MKTAAHVISHAVRSVPWMPMEAEAVHLGYLLRVRQTRTARRVAWYVAELAQVRRAPREAVRVMLGKGACHARASGFSATFEAAQRDAIKMAEALNATRAA